MDGSGSGSRRSRIARLLLAPVLTLALLLSLSGAAYADGETESVQQTSTSTAETADAPEESDGGAGDSSANGGTVTIEGMVIEDGVGSPIVQDIPDLAEKVFESDGKNNALQQAIDKALEQVKKTTQATVIISVGSGTYAGDVTIEENDEIDMLASRLILVSADAFSIDESSGCAVYAEKPDGGVKLNGSVTVDSLDVLLYGLYLSAQKAVKLTDAELEIVGTTENDTVNVEIYGSEDARFGLDVKTGDGNDTVKITQTGARYAVNTDPMEIAVDTGTGSDKIDVTLGGQQTVDTTLNGGAGNDAIGVTVASESADALKRVTVEDTEGDNTITAVLKKNKAELAIRTGGGSDMVTVSGEKEARDSILSIETGAGNDTIKLNVSIADALRQTDGTASIRIDAGAGVDTLRLTGALSTTAAERIGGSLAAIRLVNSNEKKLTLTLGGTVEHFTDDLTNKETVRIEGVDAAGYALMKTAAGALVRIAPKAFITYYYSAAAITLLRMQQPAQKALFGVLTIGSSGALTVGTVLAPGLALMVNGKSITVSGEVYADSILLSAEADDSTFKGSKIAGTNLPVEGGSQFPAELQNTSLSFFEIKGEANIRILPTAYLHVSSTAGTVTLNTLVSYTHALLDISDVTAGFNFANVKLCNSIIDIAGRIEAYAVAALAKAVVTLVASNSLASLLFVPVAVSVGFAEAGINVHGTPDAGTATIRATDEVRLVSDSALTLTTTAGTGRLPITFAVSVADNTVYTKVTENASVESGGSVTLEANGTATVKTTAQKGEKDASNSGGYFAIAVVTQDVNAGVYGNASVRAGGKCGISAVAKENVVTLATSARPKEDDNLQGEMSLSFVLEFGKNLLSKLATKFTADALDKLTKAKKQIEGADHAIAIDATKNGSAAISAAKANENDKITITVSPDKGYKLDKITVRYLAPGSSVYTSITPVKATNTTYTFTMPKADVKIAVTFAEDPQGGGGDNGGGTSGMGGNSIKDVVEKAAANNSDANRAITSEPSTSTKAKTVSVDEANIQNGAVLVDVAKLPADSVIRVLPNKQVKVAFNPAVNYTIDTLKAVYTSADGKEHEILISQNLNGEYVFNMPDANVTIQATFKQGATEKKGASSSQLTGALAVTVANNAGQALIDTTGTIHVGGAASVKATANTTVENTADATPNGSEHEDNPEGDPDDEIVAGLAVSDQLVVSEMRNGASVKAEGPVGDNKQVTFTFAPRLGYALESVICTYKNCAGETRSFTLPALSESTTQFLYQLGMEYDATSGTPWTKPKYDIAFGEKYTIVTKFKKAGNGETVLTVADEGSGSAAVQIAEGAADNPRFRDGVKAKYNDKIVFTLKGAEGYAPGAAANVSVKFTLADGTEQVWTLANKKLTVSADNKTFGFTMPNAVVTIHAAFVQKANPVEVTLTNAEELKTDGKPADPKAEYLVISEGKFVAVGDRFTVGLTDAAVLAGLKLDVGTVSVRQKFADGTEIAVVPEFHLRDKLIIGSVSDQGRGSEEFTLLVALKLVNGACAVTYEKNSGDETGNTVTAPKYADAGDTITLTPKAADNYKLTPGTLAVTVELSTGKTITGAATLGKNEKYTFAVPKPDGATIQKISVKATFAQSPGSKTAKSVSVGVGVAVAVVTHLADAQVKNGTLAAKGLAIAAASVANASSVAKAGYSAGDIGVAGSIAVNITSAKTNAALAAAPVVTLGSGSLEITASSEGKFNTNADSAGAKMKKGTGVGAAIAVGVFHTNVTALLAENAQILQLGDPLADVTVSAKQNLTQSMQTKAGTSGGTAVTPVLSLLLCETNADAVIGASSAGTALRVAGDITVTAENIVKRTVAANASAAGANVGVGASFIVTYLKDRAKARLSRSVYTNKDVNVTAKGLVTVKATSRAGANGSKSRKTASDGDASSEEGGEADKQAQKGVGSLKDLQGKSNNTSETGKQKAETSEGSISVAAAFILNLQSSTVESVIDGGAAVLAASGNVTVSSTAQMDTRLNASGSATVAKIGVGVAVALNVVSYSNLAHIEDALILAKNLSVTAGIPAAKDKAGETEEPDPNNYILVFVKGLVRKFLNILAEDTFLKAIKSTITSDAVVDTITRVILGEDNVNLKALLSGTGLEKILDANPVDTFLKNWDKSFAEIRAILKHEDYEALKELVVGEVKAQVAPLLLKFALSAIGVAVGNIPKDGFTAALKSLCGEIVNKAKKFFGDAKEPAYWADLMSDLFITASKELLSGIADLAQTKKFITDNFKGKVVENLKSYLSHIGMALTNEILDRLSAFGNLTIKAQDPVPAHTFYTYAIAGAGAFDVGVAGSAAVAWITGTTRAFLTPVAEADAEKYAVTVTGDTLVRAESVHRMETIASSAVGSNDEPDKNDSQAGDGDDSGTSTSYETKNVALKDGEKSRTLYMTTANAKVQSKTDDGAGSYTVVYQAKDGFRFTDKSVTMTDLPDTKVTKTLSADGLTLTVKVAYQGTELKDSFTVKVTGVACDERTITPPQSVTVNEVVDADVTLSKVKARKADRITITVAPKAKDGKTYELNEANIKKALEDGKLVMAWAGADGVKTVIKEYETDKKGNLIFFFLMPDENITLSITFPAASDKLPIFTELDREKQATTEEGHGVGIGAAFSLAYTQFDTEAVVGANRRVSTGTFWLDAEGGLEVQTIAVSGTDPIETKNKYYNTQDVSSDSVKKISVDAGVAFGYLGGSVKAVVESGARVQTTSDKTVNINKTKLAKDATEEAKKLSEKLVNLAVTAKEWSVTEARASAFTAGSSTAVGACVAVNYIDVSSLAAFFGTGEAKGAACITAESLGKDVARGMATAMGADMARYAKKFQKAGESIEEATNRVTNGEAFNGDSGSSKTDTGKKISTKFEKAQSGDGKKSNGGTPVSSQAARSQNAGGDAGEAIEKGNAAAQKAGVNNQNGAAKSSYQVAAAVALNITAHAVSALIGGDLRFGALTLLASNNGNFSTLATGAAMSLSKKSSAIAAAVAISLNKNSANVSVSDSTELMHNGNANTSGEVRIEARTTQNLTDAFSRYMTAQSLAGAVSGDGGSVTIAGAVSVVKAGAETKTHIGSGVRITAGAVIIGAADKSRLTARAGSVSFSKGSARGLGASFALIYAEDGILAEVGSDVRIDCTSYTLYAEKASVNASDYTALDWRFLFTNSSNLTDEQRDRTQRGIVDVHKNAETGGYTVDLNFSTDTVLELIELCNFLSAVNYYVEAISGAITSGSNTSLVASGSFALLFVKNSVESLIGDNVVIEASGDAKVTSSDSSRVRVIAGAVAAGPAKNAGGLTVGFIKDTGTVRTQLGNDAGSAAVTAAAYTQTAENASDYLVITVAVASAKQDAVGGAVTALLTQKTAEAKVADSSVIHAAGSVLENAETAIRIASKNDLRLMLISASASLAGNVAAGGTIAAVYNEAAARTVVGDRVRMRADLGEVSVTSATAEWMLNVLASASAATASGEGTSIAGAVGLLWDKSATAVQIGNHVQITAAGDLAIRTTVDSTLINIFAGAAYGGGNAVGLTLMFNYIERAALSGVGDHAALSSGSGNISVDTLGTEWTLIVGAGIGVAAKGNVLAGTNGVTLSKSTAETILGNDCTLLAGDSISLTSNLLIRGYQIAAGVGISGGGTAGVGETITVMTIENTVRTVLGSNAILTASGLGSGIVTGNRSERRRGVYIGATAMENLLVVSVSGSAGGKFGLSGVAHVLYEKNRVEAKVGAGAVLTAENHCTVEPVDDAGKTITADVKVEADDDSSIIDVAGGLTAASGMGFGATALALVFAKTVTADAGSVDTIRADGNVIVAAGAKDALALLALSFGFAKNVSLAGSANALLYENNVSASLGGTVNAGRDVSVTAASRETLVNIIVSVSLSTGVGVAAAAVLTFFDSKTTAGVPDDAALTAGGHISILSNSSEYISADVVGGAGGKVGVGGALNLVRSKLLTKAATGKNVHLTAGGDVTVHAADDYLLLSVSGMIGGGTSVGVGVVVTLSFHYNSVDAGIGTGNLLSGRNLSVLADSKRDFQTFTMTIAGAGTAAVGAAVAVLVAGGNLVQDACNTVLGMEAVKGQNYYVYYTSNTSSKEALYRQGGKYYVRSANDTMTEVAVSTVTGESGVTYNGKNYMPSAMNPQSQIEGIAAKCNVTLSRASDVNDTIVGDGNTSDKMGGSEYDRYANSDTKSRVDGGSEEPITAAQTDGTKVDLKAADSRNDTLTDGTAAHIDAGSRLTANGNITVQSHDLLLAIVLAGSVAVGGTAGVGVGFAAAKLMSSVHALVAETAVLSAAGDVTVRAICGAGNKEIAETFCPVTNTMGCQKTANDNMPSVRRQLEKTGLIASSGQTGSLWLISVAAAGGGTVGVGAAGGVLLFYSDVKAHFAGTLEKAKNLTVATELNYRDVLAVVISLGLGGTVGVGVTVAVIYLEGTLTAEIADTARIYAVTGRITVSGTGQSKLRTGAAALAVGGIAGVSANISVLINKNQLRVGVASGAIISAPEADIAVTADFKAETNALLITVAGGTVGVAASVLMCIAEMKVRAFIGVSPDESGEGLGGSITANAVAVTAKANEPVKTLIVNIAGGFVGVGAVLTLTFNRIDNVASISKMAVTATGAVTAEALLSGATETTAATATGGVVAATLVITVSLIVTRNIARVDGGTTTLRAASLDVHAKTESSNAAADVVAGASLGLLTLSMYVSVAYNRAVNSAAAETSGSIVLSGAMNVLSEGGAQANATAKTYALLSAINLSSILSVAVISADYSAALLLHSGSVEAGSVSVRTLYAAYGEGAKAFSGSAGSAPQISAFDVSFFGTFAISRVSNTAAVSGSGVLKAGSLLAEANTVSRAGAYTRQFSASIIKVIIIAAGARVSDRTQAFVSGTDATNTLTVTLEKTAFLQAVSTATVSAESITPVSLALVSIGVGTVMASVGGSTADRHTVTAYIGSDVQLTAASIRVQAADTTSATARMMQGYSISAANVNFSTVPTQQYTDVSVGVGARSVLAAKSGDVILDAADKVAADSLVDGKSIGVLVSADKKYAKNTVDQRTGASIGAGASVTAHGGVTVSAAANAAMLADTNSTQAGLFSVGSLQAHNVLTRAVNVALSDGCTITADFGDVKILAAGGEKDDIQTYARGGGAGLVGIGSIESRTAIDASAIVDVGRGVTITDTFHSVSIQAHIYEHKVVSTGDYTIAGLIAAPEIRSFVAEVKLTAKVLFAEPDSSGVRTTVTAKEITVESRLPSIHISALSNAASYMFGGTTRAYSRITFCPTVETVVLGAALRSYDRLFLFASANPDSYGTNLYVRAQGYSGAVISYTLAEAKLEGTSTTGIRLGGSTELTGTDVRVETEKFAGSALLTAVAKKAALGWTREYTPNNLQHINSTTVPNDTMFHVADAAAGICIDYYYDAEGEIKERTVGMPRENTGKQFALITGTERISLANVRIENLLPGELSVEGVDIAACKIYGQQYLENVTITNHTDAELLIGVIDTYNEAFTRSSVIATSFSSTFQHSSPGDQPVIRIESAGKGNVRFMGKVVNDRGSLSVVWTGSEIGSLYTNPALYLESTRIAPIWTHSLRIENAMTVGESETKPLEVYLTSIALRDVDGNILRDADGNVVYESPSIETKGLGTTFMKLSLTEIIAYNSDTLPDGMDQSAIPGRLELDKVSADDLTILCGTPFRMYYLAKAETAVIVLPGVVEFTTETIAYTMMGFGSYENLMYSIDEIGRYYIGQSKVKASETDTIQLKLYYLPNELVLYLVDGESGRDYGYAPNELFKVMGTNVMFDTSRYLLTYTASGEATVTLRDDGNAMLNLSTGLLTAGSSDIAIYLNYDAASGKWLIPDGATIIDTTLEELYAVRYTYDANGSRVVSRDANGNIILAQVTDFGRPAFSYGSGASLVNYYLMYDNGPQENVYYLGMNTQMEFVDVYYVTAEKAWVYKEVGSGHNYNEDWLYVAVDNFLGMKDFTLHADFHRATNSGERYSFSRHEIDEMGTDETAAIRSIVRNGITFYFVDDHDNTETADKLHTYWAYTFTGGFWEDEYAFVVEATLTTPALSDLIVAQPETVTEQSTENGEVHTVTYKAYRYGSLASDPLRYVTLLSYDLKRYYPENYYGDGLQMHFTKDAAFGKIATGMNYSYDGAYVTLPKGMHMQLYLLPKTTEREACYRIFQNRWITATGKIIGKRAVGATGNYDIYTYSAPEGLLTIERQTGEDPSTRTLTFLLRRTAGKPQLLIWGDIHLERYSNKVARDIFGKFYYHNGAAWEGLEEIDAADAIKHGYVLTDDGAMVYYAGKLVFRIGKNAEGKVLHTIYKDENDSIRYSVDEDGVVSWGYEINPAAYQGYFGGSTDGSYLLTADPATGELHTDSIVVEAGAVLKIDAASNLPQAGSGDVRIGRIELKEPDNTRSPWPDGSPIPAGGLIADVKGSMEIGEAVVTGGTLALDPERDLIIEHLNAADSTVDLSAGGSLSIGEADVTGGSATITARESVTLGTGSITPEGMLSITATGGDVRMTDMTLGGEQVALEAGGDLVADALEVTDAGALTANAGGSVELTEMEIAGGSATITARESVTLGTGSITPEGMLSITATGGDVRMTDMTLGGEQVALEAGGDIRADHIKITAGNGLTATAGGDVILVESDTTRSGALRMTGRNIYLRDNTGDLLLGGLKAAGNILLRTDGSVRDISGNATTPLMTNLRSAQAAEDAALRVLMPLLRQLDDAIWTENAAEQAVFEAQQKLNETDPSDKRAIKSAQKKLRQAQQTLLAAQEKTGLAQAAVDEVRTLVTEKHLVVEAARRALDADLGRDDATLKAGGDLNIVTTGDVGSASAPVLTDAAGNTTLAAEQRIILYSESNITLDGVSAEKVTLISAAGIAQAAAPGAPLTAQHAELTSLGGSVGAAGNPVRIDEDTILTASGNDVFVRSRGDLRVRNMTAHGTSADGDLPNGYLWMWADGYFYRGAGTQLVYGRLFLHCRERVVPQGYAWIVLTDEPTGVTAAGFLTPDARLAVTTAPAGGDWAALMDACPACAMLRGAMGLSGRIGGFTVSVTGGCYGRLHVSVLAGEGIADGTVLFVLCCVGGKLVLLPCTVAEGRITFAVYGQNVTFLLFDEAAALYAYLDAIGAAGEGQAAVAV